MLVIAVATWVRAACATCRSAVAGTSGSCQVNRLGRHVACTTCAPSHSPTWSALAAVADNPTMRTGESAPRTRASSASSNGPRAGSPRRWISSTTMQLTSASAARSDEARQTASNFSVVATHRSAWRTLSTSVAYSPDSRSTRKPSLPQALRLSFNSSVSERCGTSQAALRPSSRTACNAATMPTTVLPAPVGAVTTTCRRLPSTAGTA
jgi:hypothetical protein